VAAITHAVKAAGRVAFEFHARDVNLVMGPAPGAGPVRFRLFLDGGTVAGASGTDVASATAPSSTNAATS
jgi:hypothetical protein